MNFADWTEAQLGAVRAAGQWRTIRTFDALGPSGTLLDRGVVSFASNDYLGLSAHPTVIGAAHEALDRWGTGATASRLVVGSRPVHAELEAELADWKQTEHALLFPTGYAANLGVLSTLGGPDCTIISDELNHASIIDGCRLSRSPVEIVKHNDAAEVGSRLASVRTPRSIVVTDSVFSMDGDEAPLEDVADACAEHDALLVVDEAHAVFDSAFDVGCVEGLHLLRVVTHSKALGSLGGAVCGPRGLLDLLVNKARSQIFSTGSTPADAAASLAALRLLRSPRGVGLVERLRKSTDRLLPGHPSPIVPIVVGSELDAVSAADALLDRGLLVPAIRPPTVAPGTSRLRIALSSAHTDEHLDRLEAALADLDLAPSP